MDKYKIYSIKDLQEILPFGKTKFNQLLKANILPVIKIGKDYITNSKELDKWFEDNRGKELFY